MEDAFVDFWADALAHEFGYPLNYAQFLMRRHVDLMWEYSMLWPGDFLYLEWYGPVFRFWGGVIGPQLDYYMGLSRM